MLDPKISKGVADSGEKIYTYHTEDGRRIPLNSLYSPIKEAERFSSKVSIKEKVVFLIGMGNGSLVKYWSDNHFGFISLIIIEPFEGVKPDEDLLKIIRNNKNISFFYYKDFSSVLFSSLLGNYTGIDMELIVHPNYEKTNVEYMRGIIAEIKNGIKIHRINVNTGFIFRKDWVLEPLLNLKYTYNITSIEELKGKFKGERAVLAASGPSLAELITVISKFSKYAYIFAAGSAVNGLINNGIIPDFVTVFDSSERNYNAHFKDSKYTGPLIVGGIVNSKILNKHKGDAILVDLVLDNITKRARPELETFQSFPSVALLTLKIINYLGFSEIYLAGQDLSLVNGNYYAKGVHEHDASKDIKPDLYIENNDGGKVGTTYSLYSFLQSLENLIATIDNSNVYNLSKRGAKIKGAQYVECEAINFLREKKNIKIKLRPKVATKESLGNIAKFLDEFLYLFLEVERIEKKVEKILSNKKVSIKDTEKALKALRTLRSHAILEDVVTPQLIFQMSRINNIVEYLIKKDDVKKERKLLIDELNNSIKLIYSLLKDIIYDQRYIELLNELNMIDREKYKALYEDI